MKNTLTTDLVFANRFKQWSRVLAALVAVLSVLVLTGWFFDIDLLKRPIPGLRTMDPTTAVCFILLVSSFFMGAGKSSTNLQKQVSNGLAFVVGAVGILKLIDLVFNTATNVDSIFFRSKTRNDIVDLLSDKMSPITAGAFVLIGIALLLQKKITNKNHVPTQYLALIVVALGSVILLGYLYSVQVFYALFDFVPMAIHTALSFVLLAVALLFANPDKGLMAVFSSDTQGAALVRRMILMAVIVPVILGYLRLYTDWKYNSIELGVALMILANIVIFLILIVYSARLLFAKDVEQKVTEESLHESLREVTDLKYALDEASIVVITDAKGVINYVNDSFCRISKYSREELLGQDHRIINSGFHPKEFIKDLWVTIANGKVWKGELKNRARDGTFYWVDTTITPFLNEKKKPYQYVAIRFDITDRKTRELEVQNLNSELESFSYSVSHDLRAPLRALEGFANALSENYAEKLDEEANRWIDYISKNAKRMDTLINDMLHFSRVSRGDIFRTNINMRQLAQECFEISEKNYGGKQITFQLEEIPPFYGDLAMIRQIWQNLISNALKYSSKNESIEIAINGRIENGSVIYSIRDNGVGFDEKYKEKLFAVFQRLHANSEFEGTGVGLAIVSRIIQKHGGEITASSQLGKGAEFTVRLNNIEDIGDNLKN